MPLRRAGKDVRGLAKLLYSSRNSSFSRADPRNFPSLLIQSCAHDVPFRRRSDEMKWIARDQGQCAAACGLQDPGFVRIHDVYLLSGYCQTVGQIDGELPGFRLVSVAELRSVAVTITAGIR